MATAVEQARAAGYSDTEIANHLAKAATGFDIDAARKAGYTDAELVVFLVGKDPTTGKARGADAPAISGQTDGALTARRVTRNRERAESDQRIAEFENNPTRSGTPIGNLAAGFGKSFVDTGRGVRQIGASVADIAAGDTTRSDAMRAEIDESRRLDAPLMRTGAGTIGNISGVVAQTVPLAFVPGANTIAGSTLIGGATGAVQPVATGESRLANTVTGGGAGVAGPVIARTSGATWRAGKSFVEPFTASGRDRIAARTFERFGVTPADVAGTSSAPTATGARLPLAEQITRPEGAAAAARLQDSVRAANPQVAAQMAAREGENNAARVATLERMGAGRAAAVKSRADASKPLYDAAQNAQVEATGPLRDLLGRPSLKSAWARAKALADESGDTLVVGKDVPESTMASSVLSDSGQPFTKVVPGQKQQYSGKAFHYLKMAMDDMLGAGQATGIGAHEATALGNTRSQFMKLTESMVPELKAARETFAAGSRPVNQADIAEELLRQGSANTTDLSGTARLMPNKLTGAVRDERKLIKQATGRDLNANLSDVLEPDQLAAVNAVVGEVDRAAAVARAGNGPGSATAQRLAGQNIVEQTLSRTGLPAAAANSVTLQEVIARPLNFLYKGAAEPRLQMTLGEALLDPNVANRVMAALAPSQRTAFAKVLSNPLLKQAAVAALPAAAVANRR